jgi:hypothetical protein
VVKVTGGHNSRVSLAALICLKPGCRPRLIYRVHRRARGGDRRKGFTEMDYAALLDAAHQQLGGPLVVVSGQLEYARQRRHDRADRCPGLADRLPAPAIRA